MQLTQEEIDARAKEIRREYKRAWYNKNKDKVKAANERYWRKKAEKEAETQQAE